MAEINLPQSSAASNSTNTTGERVIPAFACLYPPAINANDLLLVNFDQQAIEHCGLYLVEEIDDAGKVAWMGCRRFDCRPGKTVVDVTGQGDWRDLSALPVQWRIAGEVRQVFKPATQDSTSAFGVISGVAA